MFAKRLYWCNMFMNSSVEWKEIATMIPLFLTNDKWKEIAIKMEGNSNF